MAQLRFPRPPQHVDLRYVREPEPIRFPEEAEVPEGKRHLVLRTFLFRLLHARAAAESRVRELEEQLRRAQGGGGVSSTS